MTDTQPQTQEVKKEAAPAPQVDADALAKHVAEVATKVATEISEKRAGEKATEIAASRLKEIGQALTGEKAPDPSETFLKSFVTNPLQAFHSVKEITKNELREEQKQAEAVAKVQRDAVTPFISEYPELNSPKKLAMVEKLAEQYQASGMDYADALKKGCEETVSEFQLKSVSDEERNSNYSSTGLPTGGSVRQGKPSWNDEKSQSDFLSGMKSKMSSFRKKSQ